MKRLLFVLFALVFFACGTEKQPVSSLTENKSLDNSQSIADSIATKSNVNEITSTIRIYSFIEDSGDSIPYSTLSYQGDKLVSATQDFYSRLPVISEYINEDIVEQAKEENPYETFRPKTCEVGGTSAWNKYEVLFDSLMRPVEAVHYKAFYEFVDEEGEYYTKDSAEYFVGETVYFEYDNLLKTQKVFRDSVLIEILSKKYSKSGELLSERWKHFDKDYIIVYNK